jgi:hypothetical protein
MTRRELNQPAEDVESQSIDLDVSRDFSQQPSILPTYEDAVADTPMFDSEDAKKDHNKMVSGSTSSQADEAWSSFL